MVKKLCDLIFPFFATKHLQELENESDDELIFIYSDAASVRTVSALLRLWSAKQILIKRGRIIK